MKLPILVDCDGILSNWIKAAKTVALRDFDVDVLTEHWGWTKAIPGLDDKINEEIAHNDFCLNMEEYPGSIRWLRRLEAEFGVGRVYVCTAPWNEDWLSQRSHWLAKRGVPLERQIQVKNKYLVQGHLVDDGDKNLVGGEFNGIRYEHRPWNQGFCLARPWNREISFHARGNYEDALAWLTKVVH